jgi:hypothetical protein
MASPKPTPCIFSEQFLQAARRVVRQRTAAVQTVQRFRLALLLHEQPTLSNAMAAEVVGFSSRQVQRWRQRWNAGDFSVSDREGRGRKAVFSPAGSRHGEGDRL